MTVEHRVRPQHTPHAPLLQGPGFRVQGSGCRVQGAGFRVQGSGFRVQGSGFRVQGPGFRVQGRAVTIGSKSSQTSSHPRGETACARQPRDGDPAWGRGAANKARSSENAASSSTSHVSGMGAGWDSSPRHRHGADAGRRGRAQREGGRSGSRLERVRVHAVRS